MGGGRPHGRRGRRHCVAAAARLPDALERLGTLEGHLDEVLETVAGIELPLDELPDDPGGAALRSMLAPVTSALETVRETVTGPLQELRAASEQLRTLLTTAAALADWRALGDQIAEAEAAL